MFPGTLLPPILLRISASAAVIVPNCAWPSGRGLATAGTVMSCHPALIPAALVIDDEHRGNVSEDVDEGARIVGIGRQAGFGFQHDAHRADRGQSAISSGDGQLHVSVVHPGDYGGKDVGFRNRSCRASNTGTAGWNLRLRQRPASADRCAAGSPAGRADPSADRVDWRYRHGCGPQLHPLRQSGWDGMAAAAVPLLLHEYRRLPKLRTPVENRNQPTALRSLRIAA
jgi:hypothetical protein